MSKPAVQPGGPAPKATKWQLPVRQLKHCDKRILEVYASATARSSKKPMAPLALALHEPGTARLRKNPSSESVHEKLVMLTPHSDMFTANNLVKATASATPAVAATGGPSITNTTRKASNDKVSPDRSTTTFHMRTASASTHTQFAGQAPFQLTGALSLGSLAPQPKALSKNMSTPSIHLPSPRCLSRALSPVPYPSTGLHSSGRLVSAASEQSSFLEEHPHPHLQLHREDKLIVAERNQPLRERARRLAETVKQQFHDLVSKRDELAEKVEQLAKRVLPVVSEGLAACLPENIVAACRDEEALAHLRDTFRRTVSLLLANYQRMALSEVELAKLVDRGPLSRQFRLVHSNRYVLRAHSGPGLAALLEARLRRDFQSPKIAVALVHPAREQRLLSSTKLAPHDVELEVRSVPLSAASEVRQAVKSLRLVSRSLPLPRDEGFYQHASSSLRNYQRKFAQTVAVSYSAVNAEGDTDLLIFESFAQKHLDLAISEYRKLAWDRLYCFQLEEVPPDARRALPLLMSHRERFVALGEAWLSRLSLGADGTPILCCKIEEKAALVDRVLAKLSLFSEQQVALSALEFELLQLPERAQGPGPAPGLGQSALDGLLKSGKCVTRGVLSALTLAYLT